MICLDCVFDFINMNLNMNINLDLVENQSEMNKWRKNQSKLNERNKGIGQEVIINKFSCE